MKKAYISENCPDKVLEYLNELGYKVNIVRKNSAVYDAVSCHPDIFCWKTGDHGSVIEGQVSALSRDYPGNIIYNAVLLDKYLIHNLKYTAPEIIEYANTHGLAKINVKQGFTKCSCVVVDGKSVITDDESIYRALSPVCEVEVLKVEKGHVQLPGHEYGFIGGTSGTVGDTILFCGDLKSHPDFEKIDEFITKRGKKVKYFQAFPLLDVGTIFTEE